MEWQLVVALIIVVPVILFPAAFVWYLNLGGLYAAVKEARARKAAQEKGTGVKADQRFIYFFSSESPGKGPAVLWQEGMPAVEEKALAAREDEDRPGLPQEPAGKPSMLDRAKPGLLSEIPGEEPSVRNA